MSSVPMAARRVLKKATYICTFPFTLAPLEQTTDRPSLTSPSPKSGLIIRVQIIHISSERIQISELPLKEAALVVSDLFQSCSLDLPDHTNLVSGLEEALDVDGQTMVGDHGGHEVLFLEVGNVEELGGFDGVVTKELELVTALSGSGRESALSQERS